MSTTHSIYSFLIFTILLSSSISSFTLAETNATVTDKLIKEICNQTKKPPLCLKNLNPSKGKNLHDNPIAILGGSTMDEAQFRAKRMYVFLQSYYENISVHKREIRIKYVNCHSKYKIVLDQIEKAKKSMSNRAPRFVGTYITVADMEINYCDKQLMNLPRAESTVLKANADMKDLFNIVLAVCKTIAKWT
ncbi:hypothetical protein ACP275_01G012600 [Erythranthe tilingii]